MTDKDLFHKVLVALGGVKAGGEVQSLKDQLGAIEEIRGRLKEIKADTANKLRVAMAQENAHERIKPEDHNYGVHMTHCYGLDYDSVYGDEKPTERYSCKYGEDDICPAALFEDPWQEWNRIVEETKNSGEKSG